MIDNILNRLNIDIIVIPSVDEFFGEYVSVSRNRLLKVTGFTGSNGIAIIGLKDKIFLTDGRYFEQASKELDKSFKIIDITEVSLTQYLKSIPTKKIGFLQELHTFAQIEKFPTNIVPISCQEFDKLINIDTNFVESLESRIIIDNNKTGINTDEILAKIKLNNDEAMLICDPASVCWLLNIRGKSVEYCGLFNAYLAIFSDGSYKIINNLYNDNEFIEIFKNVKIVKTSFKAINYHLYKLIADKAKDENNPFIALKAIKNQYEITGMTKANLVDSIAINKFIKWIKFEIASGSKISEIEAISKLLSFRKQSSNFIEQSFGTICGSGANSSIIHYHSTAQSDRIIGTDDICLIDSGGHYDFYGTSDITRTICMGVPPDNIKNSYTLVLKCHIALATAVFPIGTTGCQIDAIARANLWKQGKDYGHGTGHGVGCYLSVHEGPCSISKKNLVPLEEGMILSNEPGFYLPGEYGIRLENLMLVQKHPSFKNMLCFETISFVEFETDLINYDMLTLEENLWINLYHSKVTDILF